MLNQLIHIQSRIQSRYVGLAVDGCLIDGLAVMSGVFLRQQSQYFGGNYLPTLVDDHTPTTTGDRIGWTKRWHRMLHWHSFPHCLQLQQG